MRATRASSPGKRSPHLVQEAAIDLVDDLELARQQLAEQRQRPGLERLGQQRVVGVGERAPVISHAVVPLEPRSSTSSRISSATAIDGCVSFSCTANIVRRALQRVALHASSRRSMSCSEQETKKYCCSERSACRPPARRSDRAPWLSSRRSTFSWTAP